MKQNKKRMFLFNQKYKKGISPLITVILLVVIAVVLISLILSFGKNFINDSISETKNLTIFSESEAGMYTTIENGINGRYFIIYNLQRCLLVIQ